MADIPMPGEIAAWMASMTWGRHHLRWHVERIWDRLPPDAIAWASSNGWSRYPLQEGEETNGLAFLAMHRFMITALVTQFPNNAGLFTGWTSPPTDANDSDDPIPSNSPLPGPFSSDMSASILRIETMPASFDGDDGFGLFVETGWRPFPNEPSRRSPDVSAGIHNYIHGRFTDQTSAINMGNPEVNLQNRTFWRLHGWIDRKWSDYRNHSGRSETDPTYKAALEEAEHHMMHMAPMVAAEAIDVAVPRQVADAVSQTLFGRM